LVLPGSRARIVRCGGRYDPQLVKRSSEWVSDTLPKFKNLYLHTTFRRHISIYGGDMATSGLKKTNVRHIGIFLAVATSTITYSRRSNGKKMVHNIIVIGVLFCIRLPPRRTSYTISRWRQRWVNTISGFVFDDVTHPKVKVYPQTKFRQRMLMQGWDITTSGLEKKTSAILEFFFRFYDFVHITVIGVLFCTRLPNYVQIGLPVPE